MTITSKLSSGLALALLVACQAPAAGGGEPDVALAQSSEALNQGSFYYLRCNATGWGVDDRTRLVPTGKNGVLELSFQVTQGWMVDDYDDCVITETPVKNGWGNWQHDRGTAEAVGEAPLAARLLDLPENTYSFKVSYPALGRYRAVVQLAEGSLAITKAAPVPAGEARWAGIGNLTADAQGRLYRQSFWPTPLLSRVDAASGYALWTRVEDVNSSFELSCSYGNAVLVREGGFISLLDSGSGVARWSTNLDGELSEPNIYPYIRCDADEERILVVYNDRRIAAIRRSDGARLWTYDSPNGYPSVAGWVAGTAIIETYGATTRFTALDLATGATRWTLDEGIASSLTIVKEVGGLFFSSDFLVRRLDAATGSELWRIASSNQWPWVGSAGGVAFLHDGAKLSALNPDGSARWSVSGPDNTYPALSALNDGSFLFYVTDYAGGRTDISRLRTDGSAVWTRSIADGNAWPQLDQKGKIYVRQGNNLSLLDAQTGATRWTFAHTPEQGYDGPGGTGGLGSVVDSDDRSVYVTTYGPGFRYPPMAMWSLNLTNGSVRWVSKNRAPLMYVAGDAQLLHVSFFPYGHSLALVK